MIFRFRHDTVCPENPEIRVWIYAVDEGSDNPAGDHVGQMILSHTQFIELRRAAEAGLVEFVDKCNVSKST